MTKDEALKMALNAMANKMESDNHGNPLTKYDEALQRAMDAGVEALATNKESSLVQPTIKESLNVEQLAQVKEKEQYDFDAEFDTGVLAND